MRNSTPKSKSINDCRKEMELTTIDGHWTDEFHEYEDSAVDVSSSGLGKVKHSNEKLVKDNQITESTQLSNSEDAQLKRNKYEVISFRERS
ncbi:hypothetical protein J32TS6_18750 [Virgibacillus pantothenticus]|uniref:hypothetical protein n=1 Tax=Virgibacillus pantothenticus TaxID=1473 RepID=UPI001B154C51|nr:hypothetical protein [Virgibacillus pantothenticus]GIP63320.1 hypothetical protein J32TS6_18750 [Virgibacillus pantothenticus]